MPPLDALKCYLEKKMDQHWFEMTDILRKKFNKSVWLPLRVNDKKVQGKDGYLGFVEEYYGCVSIAVPRDKREDVKNFEIINLSHVNRGYHENESYTPCDEIRGDNDEIIGIYLGLKAKANSDELSNWCLHQDFVLTLELNREGDTWVSPNEGYIQVARIHRDDTREPYLLEVRSEHLKDYLCARRMGLFIVSYYDRSAVLEDVSAISWENGTSSSERENYRWNGHVQEIHEGGHWYGEKVAIFHMARTDADITDDIPELIGAPTDGNIASKSWERDSEGRKLYSVMGRLWKNDWVEPAKISPRVKGEKPQPTIYFIIDEQGQKENKDTLSAGGKWLWFKPDVIMALAHRRGGNLEWHTRETGSVSCSPNYSIHFGVNGLGLVNVYAKDVALLPEWQQQIWSGYNISPEGGVSSELFSSQVQAMPLDTQAPEAFLKPGLERINQLSSKTLNILIVREHELFYDLLDRTHRFRAVDDAGLFALAKDLTRLTADSFDASAIQTIVKPPPKSKWGSLKSLEKMLATKINPENAKSIMSPLVGAYELRLADAHLPGKDNDDAFSLLEINRDLPTVIQGYQLLDSCVSSIFRVIRVLTKWREL